MEIKKFRFKHENDKGQPIVNGEISGESEISLLDDLKFKAVIALLNSIDNKNFNECGKNDLFDQYITEIEETIYEMKKYDEFQGRS